MALELLSENLEKELDRAEDRNISHSLALDS